MFNRITYTKKGGVQYVVNNKRVEDNPVDDSHKQGNGGYYFARLGLRANLDGTVTEHCVGFDVSEETVLAWMLDRMECQVSDGDIATAKVGQSVIVRSRGCDRLAQVVKVGRKNIRVEYVSPSNIEAFERDGWVGGFLVTGKTASEWKLVSPANQEPAKAKADDAEAKATRAMNKTCDVLAAIANIKADQPSISKAAALRTFRAAGGSCAGKRFRQLFESC